MDDARKLLLRTKVKALGALSGSNLIQLLDTDTVERALKVLAENRILSAPVSAPVVAPQGGGQTAWPGQLANSDIMGFVCVNDILISFLESYAAEFSEAAFLDDAGQRLSSGGPRGGGGGFMLSRMRRLEELGMRFAQQELRQLSCKGCDGDFLHSRHAGEASLLELIYYGFLDPKRRGMHEGEQQAGVVHRVALFDNAGAITSIISQSDVCCFLADHLARLGGLAAATMEQLGWDRKPVVSCTPETPALDAMRLMVAEGVSSLAVVAGPGTHTAAAAAAPAGPEAEAVPGSGSGSTSETAAASAAAAGSAPAASFSGRLLGNFSASEMRTMTSEHFGALSLPVGEFLALEHDTEYVAANRERLLAEGVLGSPAHEFIHNRLRRARTHAAGEDVGQQLIVASPASTFGEVVNLLVRHRIHRVYVVDEREAPVGIVTCTDILRKVVEVATAAAPSPTAAAGAAAAKVSPWCPAAGGQVAAAASGQVA